MRIPGSSQRPPNQIGTEGPQLGRKPTKRRSPTAQGSVYAWGEQGATRTTCAATAGGVALVAFDAPRAQAGATLPANRIGATSPRGPTLRRGTSVTRNRRVDLA